MLLLLFTTDFGWFCQVFCFWILVCPLLWAICVLPSHVVHDFHVHRELEFYAWTFWDFVRYLGLRIVVLDNYINRVFRTTTSTCLHDAKGDDHSSAQEQCAYYRDLVCLAIVVFLYTFWVFWISAHLADADSTSAISSVNAASPCGRDLLQWFVAFIIQWVLTADSKVIAPWSEDTRVLLCRHVAAGEIRKLVL